MTLLSKHGLYEKVNVLRASYGELSYPLDIIGLIKNNGNISLNYADFTTKGLCGVAVLGLLDGEKDIMILNTCRTPLEQQFDAAHELIHLKLHRECDVLSFNCFEKKNRSSFLEWQANEGAAELLVPYRNLMCYLSENLDMLQSWDKIKKIKNDLTEMFMVTPAVIAIRLESLAYEISSLINGTPIDEINLMSAREIKNKNIQVKSLNQIQNESFNNILSNPIII